MLNPTVRKQPKPRPFSRLDVNINMTNVPQKKKLKENIVPVGIPDKLISGSKPFPFFEEVDKENQRVVKKHYKLEIKVDEQNGKEYFKKRVQSHVVSLKKAFGQSSNNWENKEERQTLREESPQVLNPSESDTVPTLSRSVECKNKNKIHPRGIQEIKARISQENSKSQQRNKRRKSIGEQAYVPYDLQSLKEQIAFKVKKN